MLVCMKTQHLGCLMVNIALGFASCCINHLTRPSCCIFHTHSQRCFNYNLQCTVFSTEVSQNSKVVRTHQDVIGPLTVNELEATQIEAGKLTTGLLAKTILLDHWWLPLKKLLSNGPGATADCMRAAVEQTLLLLCNTSAHFSQLRKTKILKKLNTVIKSPANNSDSMSRIRTMWKPLFISTIAVSPL